MISFIFWWCLVGVTASAVCVYCDKTVDKVTVKDVCQLALLSLWGPIAAAFAAWVVLLEPHADKTIWRRKK
jgi:hypothetical protein